MENINSAKREEFQRISLNLIDPGPTNPRKTFETSDWAEFVESVRTHGVMQPGLCRPSPKKAGRFELVAGERRFRASVEGGQKDMPLMVRELSDAQVVELQQIENLQREDLSVMEEAQGYLDWTVALMKPGATLVLKTKEEAVAHICERIHKKRSHVWDRLRLLDTVAPVQEAVRSGKLEASKATLIAKVPKALQPVVAKRAMEGDYGSGPLSYRALNELIAEEYRQPLKDAQFEMKKAWVFADAAETTRVVSRLDLAAGVVVNWGPCVTCPHRAGNLPDAESDDYTCTNPPCYRAKQMLHAEEMLAEALRKGKKVIPAKEYQKNPYTAFEAADRKCYLDDKSRTYGMLAKLAGMQPNLTVDTEFNLVEVFTNAEAQKIREWHKIGGRIAGQERDRAKELARQKQEQELVNQCYRANGKIAPALVKLLDAMGKNMAPGKILWRRLALGVKDWTSPGIEASVAKAWGLAEKTTKARAAWDKWFQNEKRLCIDDYQRYVVTMLLLSDPVEGGGYSTQNPAIRTEYGELAAMAGVKLADFAPGQLVGSGKVQLAQEAVAAINKGLNGKPAKGNKAKQRKLF